MPSTCFKPIKAKVMRLVRLDSCGRVVTGTTGQLVSDGFVSIAPSPQYEEGEEFIVRNAFGDLCVNEKDPDRLKRIDLTITLCAVDPEAIEMMTGGRLITDGGTSVGNAFDEDPNETAFGLEVWQRTAGGVCGVGGALQWVHHNFFRVVNARIGDFTMEYGPTQWEIQATTLANPNFGSGPFDLWTPAIGATEHYAYQITQEQPPEALCGVQTL
jgi:hypothetical protein